MRFDTYKEEGLRTHKEVSVQACEGISTEVESS